MCTILKYLLFLLGISFSGILAAQKPLSIKEAVKIGLRRNFKIQITNYETAIAKGQLANFSKEQLPRIELGLKQKNELNSVDSPTSFLDGFYSDNSLSLFIETNWTIYDGGRIKIEKKKLQALNQQSQGNAQLVIENTIHTIRLAYYKTLLEKEATKVIYSLKEFSKEKWQSALIMHKLGKLSNYEIQRFENAFLADSSKLLLQEVVLETAFQDLYLSMGINSNITFDLTDTLVFDRQKKYAAILEQKLIHDNQQLKNQYLNLQLISINTTRQRSFQKPRFRLNGGIQEALNITKFSDSERITGQNFDFYLGFTLDFTLFDGGAVKRKIDERRIMEAIGQLKIDELTLVLKNKLKDAVRNYNQQLAIILINEQLVQNLKQNLKDAGERFQAGRLSILELRTVQLELLQVNLTLLSSIFKLKQQEMEIHRLTGKH